MGSDRRKVRDRRISQAVISEKALDVDLIHVIRALSLEGRRHAIAVLMDILNTELKPLRATLTVPDESGHTGDTPRVRPARPPRQK